jgi:SAM-dependent methyltransferase
MSEPRERKYEGQELDLFAHAQNWKRYFRDVISPYIGQRVAEVGAGNGSTTQALSGAAHQAWFALEPDRELLAAIVKKRELGSLPATVQPVPGMLADIAHEAPLDTILYIDVLEHIADDAGELERAAALLGEGGRLVVLSPAYQALYTPFDAAVGHHRRYTLGQLRRLTPGGMTLERGFYLDSVGVMASAANLLMLKQSLPKLSQILLWDRVMVPCSRILDVITGRTFGRSVVAVWRRGSKARI